MADLGKAEHIRVEHSRARQGSAVQGKTEQSKAGTKVEVGKIEQGCCQQQSGFFCRVFLGTTAAIGTIQSAAVKGVLKCNGEPVKDVLVKLYDDDSGLDADDLMDTSHSDEKGEFELSGDTDEIGTIDPKVNIYHDCDDKLVPCQRKVTIKLPDSYVTKGSKKPKKVYNIGSLELAGKYPGETRDCIH
ncbi:unnamed protein product [Bursaphelenchus okinawaensis]|uniref:Uncharacterized protein n=1 Tax=Bursaphelenchus okinawaensis TaxID=465554 RepID=A0A811JRF7_9BILA|nr:unnamed protein product [Bursaphelenchus okinawaensis]CAG9079421.1 unnamed protein product [Bursaphelenchus okinawaensis]